MLSLSVSTQYPAAVTNTRWSIPAHGSAPTERFAGLREQRAPSIMTVVHQASFGEVQVTRVA